MAVSELNSYINRQLQYDPILSQVLVVGEISNFKKHSSGHLYFTLKDKTSKIQCVMFQSDAELIDYLPIDGEKTEVTGRISVYEREGRYQVYVKTMAPIGQGELFKAFMKMKERLDYEGYFDKSQMIPSFPSTIGVITSPTGAAIRDFLTIAKRRNPFVNIIIYPVHVQGDQAKFEISAAVDYFNESSVDVIVLTRGGGSLEELWAFNELMVAESIFESKIPVVSAIGHETDFSISDFVADKRAATPSEAAEIVVKSVDGFINHLNIQKSRLISTMDSRIQLSKVYLDRSNKNKLCQLILREISDVNNRLVTQYNRLRSSEVDYTNNQLNTLEKLGLRLNSVSPLTTLKRGYAVVEKDNKSISSIDDIEVTDSIDIILKNGIIRTEVISKERKQLHESV